MNHAPLRVGIIGCGHVGTQHATYFANANPATRLVAVADLAIERGRTLASRLRVDAFQDASDLIAASKLDLVVVATPDPYHLEPVVAAATAGVPNIIVEKPMATSIDDATAMMKAAEAAGARLWVHLPSRCLPEAIASRYVIQEGLIGDLVYGDLVIDDNISVPTNMWKSRSSTWARESSVAQFLMSHLCDRMRWMLADDAEKVEAQSINRVLKTTPDLYDAKITWSSGLVLRMRAGWIRNMEPLVTGHFTLFGSAGTIHQTNVNHLTEPGWQVTLDRNLSTTELEGHQRALKERSVIARAVIRRPYEEIEGPGERLSLDINQKYQPAFGPTPLTLRDHIVNAILEDVDVPASWQRNGPLPTARDGLVQTRMVVAIEQAAQNNCMITLDS